MNFQILKFPAVFFYFIYVDHFFYALLSVLNTARGKEPGFQPYAWFDKYPVDVLFFVSILNFISNHRLKHKNVFENKVKFQNKIKNSKYRGL